MSSSTLHRWRNSQIVDAARDAARLKSYTSAAIITMLIYPFLFIPGFIANLLWYNEAKRMENIAGESLPGVGCLWVELIVGTIMLGITMVVVALYLYGMATLRNRAGI